MRSYKRICLTGQASQEAQNGTPSFYSQFGSEDPEADPSDELAERQAREKTRLKNHRLLR